MSGEARPIGTCLIDPGSPAAALFQRAQALQRYQQALEQWAQSMQPGTPAPSSTPVKTLRAVNLRNGTLVIHADNAAALTALRYRSHELLRHLQARFGAECSRIDAKVMPTQNRTR